MMQYTDFSSPVGLAGETDDEQAQAEVDRLAAAPRKTLNRNPAGKIACSKSSQGGADQAWPMVRAPVHDEPEDITMRVSKDLRASLSDLLSTKD